LASFFVFQLESTFLQESKKTRKNVTKLRAITKKYSLISHPNLVTFDSAEMGHSRKYPYLPHRGNWKLTPPTPFGCPNTLGRNFLCGGSVDLFWNDPILHLSKICHFASANVSAGECNEITVHYLANSGEQFCQC
jgi:hypothetical protein